VCDPTRLDSTGARGGVQRRAPTQLKTHIIGSSPSASVDSDGAIESNLCSVAQSTLAARVIFAFEANRLSPTNSTSTLTLIHARAESDGRYRTIASVDVDIPPSTTATKFLTFLPSDSVFEVDSGDVVGFCVPDVGLFPFRYWGGVQSYQWPQSADNPALPTFHDDRTYDFRDRRWTGVSRADMNPIQLQMYLSTQSALAGDARGIVRSKSTGSVDPADLPPTILGDVAVDGERSVSYEAFDGDCFIHPVPLADGIVYAIDGRHLLGSCIATQLNLHLVRCTSAALSYEIVTSISLTIPPSSPSDEPTSFLHHLAAPLLFDARQDDRLAFCSAVAQGRLFSYTNDPAINTYYCVAS
jgi:hypothetical protein